MRNYYLLVHIFWPACLWVVAHCVLLLRGNETRFFCQNAWYAAPRFDEMTVQAALAEDYLFAWADDKRLAVFTVRQVLDLRHTHCLDQLHLPFEPLVGEYAVSVVHSGS